MPMVDASTREPKLSDFLRAMAMLYEGNVDAYVTAQTSRHKGDVNAYKKAMTMSFEGDQIRVNGVHKAVSATWSATKQIGENAAAAVAFYNVTEMLKRLTRKPCNELCEELVRVYFPSASNTDFARAGRARNAKKGKIQNK